MVSWVHIAIIYVGIRIALANRMPITDCDEVYNYWEPLHFLLYGSGMQTWEYAPQFALRTYVYLYPLLALGKLYTYLQALSLLPIKAVASSLLLADSTFHINHDHLALFLILRSTLAATMAAAELNFLNAISESVPFSQSLQRSQLVSTDVAYVTACLLLSSAGMAHASGALLPSSSFLLAWLLCAAAYVRLQRKIFVVTAVTATLAIGWPFGVLVLLPMGIHIVWTSTMQYRCRLLLFTFIYTIILQACIMMVDYRHYGRWTMPIYNIVQYNAHGGGDELYGVEPLSYYIKNAMLNFNYLSALALLILPVCFLRRILGHALPTPFVTLTASLYMWFVVVVPRPHKEERFLFPIYAITCLSAAVATQQVYKTLGGRTRAWMLLLLPSMLIGLCRTMALSKYYTAPLAVYASIPPTATTAPTVVCTCGEWYRFPSSFVLPPNVTLAFVKSSFSGQLPRQFSREGSKGDGSMFNNLNQEEFDRYLDVQECDYVVELQDDVEPASCSIAMQHSPTQWTEIATHKYLDASRTSSLHRVLYLPYLHEQSKHVTYQSYSLFQKQVNV